LQVKWPPDDEKAFISDFPLPLTLTFLKSGSEGLPLNFVKVLQPVPEYVPESVAKHTQNLMVAVCSPFKLHMPRRVAVLLE
jgi:hypothetical protein